MTSASNEKHSDAVNDAEELLRYKSTVNVNPLIRSSPSRLVESQAASRRRGENNLKFFQVGSSAQLRDTTMQSKISEEVDMGTALLTTWKSEALKPVSLRLQKRSKCSAASM